MSTYINADIERIEEAYTSITSSMRLKQTAFENDGEFAMVHRFADGSFKYYYPVDYNDDHYAAYEHNHHTLVSEDSLIDPVVFVTSAGYTGFGLSTPSAKVEISATTAQFKLSYDQNNYLIISADDAGKGIIYPISGTCELQHETLPILTIKNIGSVEDFTKESGKLLFSGKDVGGSVKSQSVISSYGMNYGAAGMYTAGRLDLSVYTGEDVLTQGIRITSNDDYDDINVFIGEDTLIIKDSDVYTSAYNDYYTSSTVLGFSAMETSVINYKTIGRTVFVTFNLRGDSNSNETSFTLPYYPLTNWYGGSCVSVSDAGSGSTGDVYYANGKFNITKTVMGAVNEFASSGTKDVRGLFWFQRTI